MEVGERIGLFQRFDRELQKAGGSLNVLVVRRILLVDQGDLPFDLFVDVIQQVNLFLLQSFDDLIDVLDDLRAKSFSMGLSIETNE